ncbi:hypothetical protein [Xanthomonas sp. XNM01]|uniref:hypothetical protein n=1 Tax=Xanthomonas sp. XNM01 TaxID=2769289 RepID=UPI00177A9144|nr:hypothetical protein [Xanthomonas sp. XNM01]MBD9368861.1 hypothetical protein [Xanthomonas sp. XNM01]
MSDPIPWTFGAGGDVTEQLQFLTDVQAADHGAEQRRGLRIAPRVVLGFDGLDQADNRRHMENLLAANGSGRWQVPWVAEGGTLWADLAAGVAAIAVDTRWRHYRAGGKALLIGRTPREREVVAIDSLTDDGLVLAAPTAQAWPAGTQIYPAVVCRLDAAPLLPRFTADAAPYSVQFRADEPVDWPADAGAATYRGLPVFEWEPDWTEDPSAQYARDVVTADNETSLPYVADLVGAPRTLLTQALTTESLQRAATLRSLLYVLDGRRCPIWVPGQAHDLVAVAGVANGAVALDVRWSGLSQSPLAEGRRDIRIQLRNGTVHYRRVTSAAQLSDSVERLTLSAGLSPGFAAGDVAMVSFLVPCRQEADVNMLRWWASGVLRTQLTFRGLRDGL